MSHFIEKYDPKWKDEFQHIKQIISQQLNKICSEIDIQHIGSTSIEGLCAKPILDIDIIIVRKDLLQEITRVLEKIGYMNKGEQGIKGRFAFRQTSEYVPLTTDNKKKQSHHLYVCLSDSLALKNHILFRDALKNDNILVQQYSELKKALTDHHHITREKYNIQKTNFKISVLKSAGLSTIELEEITKANS